jgi:hypothetical protein
MVVNQTVEGVQPKKPKGAKRLGFSNELWGAVEQCWPEDRPGVGDILSSLNETTAFWYMRDF